KPVALDAARAGWESAGYRVIGTALAARVAQELQAISGIRSTTVRGLLADLANPEAGGLGSNSVVVIDEAGMVGTRALATILDHAASAKAKVVMVGDAAQLPEI